ncbi:hypothetical protein Bca4012_084367 [Brassica carinata]
MLSDALPVADLIRHRGLKIDERCQVCGLEGESILHVLFQCDAARQVWAFSGIPQPRFQFQGGSIFSNINYLLSLKKALRGEKEDMCAWPWLLWYIWKSRNEFLFQAKRWSPNEIVLKAREEADNWFLAQEVDKEINAATILEVKKSKRRWSPPPQGWLMCNVAFEWRKEMSLLGVAWVVRNHRGVVMFHSRRAFSDIVGLEEARETTLFVETPRVASFKASRRGD